MKKLVRSAVEVNSFKVTCNGNNGVSEHPRIFLAIKSEVGEVICPYCSRRFIFKKQQQYIYPDTSGSELDETHYESQNNC